MEWPRWIAHRGASAIAPENTLEAFRLAAQWGASWIEFDLQPAEDGQLFVFHDKSLSRCCADTSTLSNLTSQTIMQTTTPYGFGDYGATQSIPSFDQLLQLAASLGLGINVELKCFSGQGVHTAHYLDRYVQQLAEWPQGLLLTSSCTCCLKKVRELTDSIKLGQVIRVIDTAVLQRAADLQFSSISADHRFLAPKQVSAAKAAGLAVMAYTVDDYQRAQALFDIGVDSVFSNVIFPPSLC
jgi:glycerophosphoryl diester phosphodiesterase